ncbi:MAG: tRNA (guanine(46)-N(7))-methyltransferase TrmB [Acutalibacteraceae bacterium]
MCCSIAIERVQDALVLAMEAAIRKGLKNVFFVSLDAANIDQFSADDEIDLLYINFCDPWPRKKNAKRRLTYHTFLEKYKKVLKLGGQIHFKTDNAESVCLVAAGNGKLLPRTAECHATICTRTARSAS